MIFFKADVGYNEENITVPIFTDTHFRNDDVSYVVRLPFQAEGPNLGGLRHTTLIIIISFANNIIIQSN